MTATRVELYAVIDSLSSAELLHLAEACWQLERRLSEERIARLADIWWGPTLGAFPRKARPYPADAPPLPPRRKKPA